MKFVQTVLIIVALLLGWAALRAGSSAHVVPGVPATAPTAAPAVTAPAVTAPAVTIPEPAAPLPARPSYEAE